MTISYRKSTLIFFSVLLLIISMWLFGHKQMGGFDMSALVDTGWRMANAQTPYIDFPLTTPIAFYVGAGWAIKLFGVRWSSFVLIAIIFTVISFLTQYYLLNMIIPWIPALAISLVSQLLCSVVTSYWWYNSTTMSTACLFLSSAYVFANRPNEKKSFISLWVCLTLLSLMKPNIAGSLAVSVFIFLLIFSPARKRVILICLAALISFFIILLLLRISSMDVITSYLAIGKERAAPTVKWFFNDKPYEHWVVLPLILLSTLPVMERISYFKVIKSTLYGYINLSVTSASFMTGVVSLLTNSDTNLTVGIPFFLLGSTIFWFLTEKDATHLTSNKIWLFMTEILILAILIGVSKIQANYHAQNTGPNMLAFWYLLTIIFGIIAFIFLFWGAYPKNQFPITHSLQRNKIVGATLIMSAGIAMFAGGMRLRVSYIGYEMFFTYSPLTTIENVSFFEHFFISPNAKMTVVEIQQVLQDNYKDTGSWKNLPVYFGPRMEFAYAAFGILSPCNLPIWWHPNNSYVADREQYYIRSFKQHSFETLIFMKRPGNDEPDFTFLPQKIIKYLLENYNRTDYSRIIVFQRNGK